MCLWFLYNHVTGTIVAMEKVPGILTKDHIHVIEAERDKVEEDLRQYIIN